MPFVHVGPLAFLIGFEVGLFGSESSVGLGHLPLDGFECGASVFEFVGGVVKLFFEIIEQFAQFALGLGVIGMVGGATHGTGGTLFELFAESDDVFALAKCQCHVHAFERLLGHEKGLLGLFGVGVQLIERNIEPTDGVAFLFDEFVTFRDAAPEGFGALQAKQTVAVVGEALLQSGTVASLIALPVDEQLTLERVHLVFVVVLLFLDFLRRRFELGLAFAEFGKLFVALGVESGLLVEGYEFVFDEVEFFKHQSVHRERLPVEGGRLNLSGELVEAFFFGFDAAGAFGEHELCRLGLFACRLELGLEFAEFAAEHVSAADGRSSLGQLGDGFGSFGLGLCVVEPGLFDA